VQHVDVVRRDAVLLLQGGDVEEALLLELEHAPLRRGKKKKNQTMVGAGGPQAEAPLRGTPRASRPCRRGNG